jgi:MFS transporter, DHA2 family, multidrug resistance protein
MNVPIGMLALLLVSRLIEDPAYLKRQMSEARRYLRIDYIGIGLLALCLGAMQIVLDRGQEDDWFVSHFILFLAVMFAVTAVCFVAWELTRAQPVMDLRMFKNRNFAGTAVMIFVWGIQVYALTVFTPQYVQAYMGYNAELAGMTQLRGAALLVLLMPIAGQLVRRLQARWIIAVGFILSALAFFHVSYNIDLGVDFSTTAGYRIWQSFGVALLFIPINTASYVGIPEQKGGEVAGTINLFRNVGGSVGISLVETMIARRAQYHQDHLIAHVTPAQQAFRTMATKVGTELLHRGLSQSQATHQASLRIYDAVITQATVLSYQDVAWLVAVICLLMTPLALLLKKNDPKAAHVSVE